jgi:hypothetical protein
MADPEQLERTAKSDNSEGHRLSFAAQDDVLLGEVQQAQNGLGAAAHHYERSALAYVQAGQERMARAAERSAVEAQGEHDRASADFGLAASIYWYAGRSYADAYDFEHAASAMELAAGAYIAQAKLLEQAGRESAASTLRVEATFRYLDAQRYFQQAADFCRNLATNLAVVGEQRAAADERSHAEDLQRRAIAAAASVNEQGPEYHAGYEHVYLGRNRSEYK